MDKFRSCELTPIFYASEGESLEIVQRRNQKQSCDPNEPSVERCPNCGDDLKIIACPEQRRGAASEDAPVIDRCKSEFFSAKKRKRKEIDSSRGSAITVWP